MEAGRAGGAEPFRTGPGFRVSVRGEREAVAMMAQGDAAVVAPGGSPGFTEYATRWARRYRIRGGTAPSGGTMRNLMASVDRLCAWFGDVPMSGITADLLERWWSSPHEEGPHSFHAQCARLRRILESARREGLTDAVWDLPMPRLPESARADVEPVTAEQLRALYEAMPGYDRLIVPLAALAGGLRVGEACALRIRDVDLGMMRLRVAHSVNRGDRDLGPSRLAPTKTRSSNRTVPIPKAMRPAIEAHIDRWCDPADPMLFQARRGEVLSPTTVQGQFRRARERAGREDITFHTLRATHASLMFVCGGTLRECMDDLGHTSEAVAVRHYQRIIPEHRRQTVDRLGDMLLPGGLT